MADIIVKLPDGSEAHFPEGTPDPVMEKALASYSAPPPSTLDNLRFRAGQLNTGAVQGLTGAIDTLIDTPRNLVNLGKVGLGALSGGINALTGGWLGESIADQGTPGDPFNTEEGIFGTKADNANFVTKAAAQAGLINPKYAPTDLQGRALNFTGNVIGGGGLLPIGKGNAVKQAILPSIGAFAGQEIAHQVAPDNPYAALAGTVAGGFAGGAPKLLQPTIGRTAERILGTATEDQLQRAQALMASGQVTAPEALAYTTGSTVGPKIQRTLEGTAGGGSVLGPYMAARTPQNAQTVAAALDAISPDMAVRDPSRTAEFVQQAAASRIKQEAGARTAAVKPFYDLAKTQALAPQQVTDVAAGLAKNALEQGTNTKIGQMLMTRARQLMSGPMGGPETNIGRLDALHDEMVQQANPGTFDPNQLTGRQSALLNQGAADLQGALRSNSAYNTGQDLYAALSRNRVGPLQNSPIGQLADIGVDKSAEGTYAAAKQALLPDNPTGTTNPDTLAFTAQELKKTNPNALPDMLRQHIQNTWDSSNKYLRGETPQFSGARFAQTLAGNDQGAQNLVALVRGASGDQAADGLAIALDRMKAQGTRLGEGSPTALNQETMHELSGGGLSQMAKPKAAINDMIDRLRLAKNSEQLANVITSKDGIAQLQALSRDTRQRLPALLQRGALVGSAGNQPLSALSADGGTPGPTP